MAYKRFLLVTRMHIPQQFCLGPDQAGRCRNALLTRRYLWAEFVAVVQTWEIVMWKSEVKFQDVRFDLLKHYCCEPISKFGFKSTRRPVCSRYSSYRQSTIIKLSSFFNVKKVYYFKNLVASGNILFFESTLSCKVGSKKRDHVNCWHHNCSFVLSGNSKSKVQWQVREPCHSLWPLHLDQIKGSSPSMKNRAAQHTVSSVDELIWAFSFSAPCSDVKNVVIFMQVPKRTSSSLSLSILTLRWIQ